MEENRHHYLIYLQFLGFRYSGWQKQPGQRTVEGMLIKTFKFLWPHKSFKLLGAGRTDAKVSASEAAFSLMTKGFPITGHKEFLELLNANLPPDIRAIRLHKTHAAFNVIQDVQWKEYIYLFSFGEKFHPFCAPLMANFLGHLDIERMKEAARQFVGTHDFSAFTARLQRHTQTVRTIKVCDLRPNDVLEANFFPKESHALHVQGTGFMRYQIRMMMGALVQVGKGELEIKDIARFLSSGQHQKLTYVAPASGLLLHRLKFEND